MRWMIVPLLALAGCGGSDTSDATTSQENDAPVASVEKSEAPSISLADQERVCRAAIADINGHSPKIVKATSSDSFSVQVTYNRPSDGKAWTNECRFEGDRVIWRTVNAFGPGTGFGRWRDGVHDETIIYTLDGNKISLKTTYPDNSSGSETYVVH